MTGSVAMIVYRCRPLFFKTVVLEAVVMEKLHSPGLYLVSRLLTGNLRAVYLPGLYSHIAYFLLGISNILIIS